MLPVFVIYYAVLVSLSEFRTASIGLCSYISEKEEVFAAILSDSEMVFRLLRHNTSNVNLLEERKSIMPNFDDQRGKIGYIILWLLGVPASILILIFLLRGCT